MIFTPLSRVRFSRVFCFHRLIASLSPGWLAVAVRPTSATTYPHRYNTQSLRSTKTFIIRVRHVSFIIVFLYIYMYYLYLCFSISCSGRCVSSQQYIDDTGWPNAHHQLRVRAMPTTFVRELSWFLRFKK
jgi:hypothetical protein